MALTLEAEQRLEAVGLVELFADHEEKWTGAAVKTYAFIRDGFPVGAKIRRDDVAQALGPILAVDDVLTDKLARDKVKGKFWISFFADLIIDRVWDKIAKEPS